jgi:hypothetical protein
MRGADLQRAAGIEAGVAGAIATLWASSNVTLHASPEASLAQASSAAWSGLCDASPTRTPSANEHNDMLSSRRR